MFCGGMSNTTDACGSFSTIGGRIPEATLLCTIVVLQLVILPIFLLYKRLDHWLKFLSLVYLLAPIFWVLFVSWLVPMIMMIVARTKVSPPPTPTIHVMFQQDTQDPALQSQKFIAFGLCTFAFLSLCVYGALLCFA